MIFLFIFVLTAVGMAQDNGQARALLEEVASASRVARSWRAEGVKAGDMTINGMQIHEETQFKIAVEGSSRMRWETSGADHTLMVCDGADHWTYYGPGGGFFRNPIAVSSCEVSVGDFLEFEVAKHLASATVIGHDHVQFAGALRECELVRAEYAVPASPVNSDTARPVRTLCIDPVLKVVLRDEMAGGTSEVRFKETTTYVRYERDITLPSDTFDFVVPTGTIRDEGPQEAVAKAGVYRVGAGVSVPTIASKVEASFTEASRQARISGMSLVSLEVDSNGEPQNIRIARGLGYGLDEKAIEAVRQWHFHPGMKDGARVAVGPLIVVVNFRLP